MTGREEGGARPEVLWPLFGTLDGIKGVGPKTAEALAAAGLGRPRDLLLALPVAGVVTESTSSAEASDRERSCARTGSASETATASPHRRKARWVEPR